MSPRYRVMVVEDEADQREIVTLALSRTYEVVQAVDGREALDRLEACEPDLVFLDAMMPVMNGFETCKAIRAAPGFGDVPVVFISVLTDPAEIKKMYAFGANYYIPKPIDPARLLRNVEMTLEHRPPPTAKKHTVEELEAMAKKPVVAVEESPPVADPIPAESRPEPAVRQPAEVARPADRPRLMIVDDSDDMRVILTKALEQDYEVVPSEGGVEAMAHILEIEPDVLILDIQMPDMDGFELCEALREMPRFADLPVVFFSAHLTNKAKKKARKAGATAYLPKGCALDEVVTTLDFIVKRPSFRVWPKKTAYDELMAPSSDEVIGEETVPASRPAQRSADDAMAAIDESLDNLIGELEGSPPDANA